LDYIAGNKNILAIFYTHKAEDKVLAALSLHLRVEALSLRFPNVDELVEYIEANHLHSGGFYLTAESKQTLREIINRHVACPHFSGFKTIDRLAHDLLYRLLSHSPIQSHFIPHRILAAFDQDTIHINKINAQTANKKIIGFTGEERI
ncbi:MAG: hypothetical protein FWE42_09850, partial [Defluviitaleaceae bacterium]|nr:hypothetical protein [Defluviitaleaceae bacterium]